jgi:hypothetical protein
VHEQVAYGRAAPHMDASKLIAVLLMFLGIGFVAVCTGAMAECFPHARSEAFAREQRILDELQNVGSRHA